MKKSKEIIGLPVISVSEGLQIGDIKGLFVNPQQKNVEFLLLDEKGFSSELRGFPFLSAEAIGDFAVIVEGKTGIIDIMKVSILKDLVNLDIDVIGTKVITKKGKYLGDVTEYALETNEGAIKSFYFQSKNDNTEKIVPVESVITIGREALIVEDVFQQTEARDTEEINVEVAEEKKTDTADVSVETVAEESSIDIESAISDEQEISEAGEEEEKEPETELEPESDFIPEPVYELKDEESEEMETDKSPEELSAPTNNLPVVETIDDKKEEDEDEIIDSVSEPKIPSQRINEIIGRYKKQDKLTKKDSELEEKPFSEKEIINEAEEETEAVETIEETATNEEAIKEEPKTEEKATVNKLVDQQKQYVMGKTLIRNIVNDAGEVIAKEGEKVNDDIFDKLYKSGPHKIVEAMTYVKD